MTTETPRSFPNPKMNRLLAKLSAADYHALMLVAKLVPLKLRKRLHQQDAAIDAVYFPLNCMVSMLVTNGGDPPVEMATIGREGVVGASELLQCDQGAMGLNMIQIPGFALRIEAHAFIHLLSLRPDIASLMHRHIYALLRQVLYGAACNRVHNMEQRCARWLLMTEDRAGKDTFPVTQDFLSHMLGVRRATVNAATGVLKKAGLIRYVRGKLTVIDRKGLESASCGCYRKISAVYESLFLDVSKAGLPARLSLVKTS